MVNTGQPSRGCATCKRRKIKCDLLRPACTQCQRGEWVCPGFPVHRDLVFRNQTSLVVRKAREQQSEISSGANALQQYGGAIRVRGPSPSLEQRATAFFICHYVCDAAQTRGNHEYLPNLLQKTNAGGALEIITAAAGLAALANAGTSSEWKSQAYAMYGTAIRRLHDCIKDPEQMKSDQTLAAVMMMGVFEVIASGDLDSMKSFGNHTIAAARCIEMRGPEQFHSGSKASDKLFVQLRRIIAMTCHQLQEPIPYALRTWSRWAETAENGVESYSNRFAELNEILAHARAEIKHNCITSPEVVSAMLLPIDDMFEGWRRSLPESWAYKSYRSLQAGHHQRRSYTSQYDVYPDLYIASTWNSYRSIRLLIHEAIVAAAVKQGSVSHDKREIYHSLKILKTMADEVCHSVPYHLGHHQNARPGREPYTVETSYRGGLPTPGAYLLFWPLFLSGMLRATPRDQRNWIASVLRRIGLQMGLRLAMSMATALEAQLSSFSAKETWFIGEFYPS